MTDARVCVLCGGGLQPDSLFLAKFEPFGDAVAHVGCADDRAWSDFKDGADAVWDVGW